MKSADFSRKSSKPSMKSSSQGLGLVFVLILIFGALPHARAQSGERRAARSENVELGRLLQRIRRQGRQPQAAVLVMRLWDIVDESDPRYVMHALDRLRSGGRLHPLVAFWLDRLYGTLAVSLGRISDAKTLWRAQGMPQSAWIMGPFPDAMGRGLNADLAPDRDGGLRMARRPVAGNAALRWRGLSAGGDGCFRPGEVLRPVGHGIVYAVFGLHLKRRSALALRVGTDSPYRISVDGRRLGERAVSREALPDQDVWPLVLGRGDHVFLFKMAAGETGWGLCFRVTDLVGRPAARVRWLSSGPDLERASALSGTAGMQPLPLKKAVSLGQRLSRDWRISKSFRAGRRFVEYLLFVRPDGVPSKEARRIALTLTRLYPSVDSWLLAASSVGDARRLDALLQALKAAPRSQVVLARLAAWYLEHGRLGEARRFLKRSQETGGRAGRGRQGSVFVRTVSQTRLTMLAARLQEAGGLWAAAERIVRQVLAAAPWHRDALKLLAEILLDSDRASQAVTLLGEAQRHRSGDQVLLQILFQAATAALQPVRALAALRSMLRMRPHDTLVVRRIADILVSLHRLGEAETVLRRAIRAVPGDAGLYRALGRVLLAGGRENAARKAWMESLRLAPQQQDLRAKLAAMKAVRRDPTVVRYRVALDDLLRKAPGPTGDAEVLWDRMVYVMRSNGAIHRFRQRVVRINSPRGARSNASWSISLQPDVQQLHIIDARVRRADGTVEDAEVHYEQEISNWQVRIYYDWKSSIVQFPKLRPGDLVEIAYTLSDVAPYNPFRGYLGLVVPLAEEIPRRHVEVIVEAPASRKLYANVPMLQSLQHQEDKRGTVQVQRWTAWNVPAVVTEPRAPGWSEIIPYLHVSTFRSWSHVAQWYWGLVREQYRSSPEVDALARRLGRRAKTVEDKVRAVYAFVTRKIRYVGLEFGIHTHKPYSAPQVLERRFGDCKDKAMLMVVLLARLGVEAHPVLVRTRQNGSLGHFPASLAVFDHAILYVPALHRFLDGTAEFTGSDDLPYQDQGVMGLIVGPNLGKLVTLPVLPATKNTSARRVRILVDRRGDAMVTDRMVLTGQFAAQWRARFRDESMRRKTMESMLSRIYPGAVIQNLRVHGDRDPDKKLMIEMRYRVPGLLRDSGEDRVMDLSSGGDRLVATFASLPHRSQELLLDFPFVFTSHREVVLPAGMQIESLPRTMRRSVRDRDLNLFFQQDVSRRGRHLFVSRRLRMGSHRIVPRAYPAFRAFCSKVDSVMADQVVVRGRRAR